MNKIKLLTPDVYNKIAAGEVIEKPASVVKELVENSIDAGANKLTIEIADGGFEYISVADNGSGIAHDDVDKAFVKYATSKLDDVTDLYAMQTMGFRGEALASISAVAKVKLTTRTSSDETGVKATANGSMVVSKEPCSCNVGTVVEVSDLFYNTPARLEFFKSHAHETMEITKCVTKLALTSPYLQITYIADGNTVLKTKGEGLDEAIYAVYGADCLKNCLPISVTHPKMRITGYVGNPDYAKHNSTYQTLSVNGRYITDKQLSVVINNACKKYMMKHQFPFFVLNVDLPFDEVDVNVHPRKAEVRFKHPDVVIGACYKAVDNAYKQFAKSKVDTAVSSFAVMSQNETKPTTANDTKATATNATARQVPLEAMEIEALKRLADVTQTVDAVRSRCSYDRSVEPSPADVFSANISAFVPKDEDEDAVQQSVFQQDDVEKLSDRAKILGSAFNTYLILEIDEKLIFVDQHAAHERILYEKFLANRSQNFQSLMFPFVFGAKPDEAEFISNNLQCFYDAGIEIEPFGANEFRISALSTLFVNARLDVIVQYVLGSLEDYRVDDKKLICDKIAQKACKAACKAGDALDKSEIEYILHMVLDEKLAQCPHGRPIFIVYSKTDFEKAFKRIV